MTTIAIPRAILQHLLHDAASAARIAGLDDAIKMYSEPSTGKPSVRAQRTARLLLWVARGQPGTGRYARNTHRTACAVHSRPPARRASRSRRPRRVGARRPAKSSADDGEPEPRIQLNALYDACGESPLARGCVVADRRTRFLFLCAVCKASGIAWERA